MTVVRRLQTLIVMIALTAGCSGSDNGPAVRTDGATPTTNSPATSTSAAPRRASDVAKRYFDAFATDRPQAMQAMLELSAPGSPAHLYARFQIASTQAETDQGGPPEPPEVQLEGDVIRLCNPPTIQTRPGVERCSAFADFTALPGSNLLTGFTVNGKPIGDRLVQGGSTASAGGARFTLAVGYQSVQSEMLLLVVEVSNGPKKISIYGSEATYVAANGRQVTATDSTGPFDVQPSASASVVVGFANATPGGRLILGGFDGTSAYEVTLPLT